jgi:hypothetical protein
MRFLFIIFSLSFTQVLGQQNPFTKVSISDMIDRADTFEINYERYTGLNHRTDTLPLYTNDEYDGWRDVQVVTYLYNIDSVRMVSFRDGQRGSYYFFFEGPYLRKVRMGHPTTGKTISYYYSISENVDPERMVKPNFKKGLLKKDKVGLLATGHFLKERFQALQ